MATKVEMRGYEKLRKHIKKMSNPNKVFDSDFRSTAVFSVSRFGRETNRKTGNTARGWQKPKRLDYSNYEVSNDVKTTDGKHLIVNILNYGRKEVRPVKAKRLYIPLSQKGMSKKTGAKIPKDFVYGVDYVLAKKSKATKGTFFIQKTLKDASKKLTRAMISTIRRVHSGN